MPLVSRLSCYFNVKPAGAQVSVFGAEGLVFEGESPASVQLAEGNYELEVLQDGFELLMQKLSVDSDHTGFAFELVPMRGGLQVVSTVGATVTAKGKDGNEILLGTVGQNGELRYERLAVGPHQFEVWHKGYRTERVTLTVPPNGNVRESVGELVRESGAVAVYRFFGVRLFLQNASSDRGRLRCQEFGAVRCLIHWYQQQELFCRTPHTVGREAR